MPGMLHVQLQTPTCTSTQAMPPCQMSRHIHASSHGDFEPRNFGLSADTTLLDSGSNHCHLTMLYSTTPLYSACASMGATRLPSAATVTTPSDSPKAVSGTASPGDKELPANTTACNNTCKQRGCWRLLQVKKYRLPVGTTCCKCRFTCCYWTTCMCCNTAFLFLASFC